MEESTSTLIFIIVVLLLVLFLKCCMDDCDAGKLTVCVGDSGNINVPKCMDFDLHQYSYQKKSKGQDGGADRIVIMHKSNAHDVVSFPMDSVITYKEQCED